MIGRKKNVLVVVDMQNDFTTGVLGNAECVSAIEKVRDVIANGDYDEIIFTMDTHQDGYLDTQEGRRLPVAHCIEGTEGHKIVQSLVDEATHLPCDTTFIMKPTFGSFELADHLKDLFYYPSMQREATIDFVGVCTGICVISNVMITKAALPEATVRVIEDACACVTPESHNTAINAMRTCQVDVI